MKLWLLEPGANLSRHDNPWLDIWDKVFGFVIRAETENEARDMAHLAAREENSEDFPEPWKSKKYTTCVELLPEGPAEIILVDFLRS